MKVLKPVLMYFALCLPMLGTQPLEYLGSRNLAVNIPSGGAPITLSSLTEQGQVVMLNQVGRRTGAEILLLDGSGGHMSLASFQGIVRAAAVDGSYLVVGAVEDGKPIASILNLATREERRVETDAPIVSVSVHNGRVALLTASPLAARLRVLDCDTGLETHHWRSFSEAGGSQISFRNDDTVLLFDPAQTSYLRLDLTPSGVSASEVKLSGPEIEYTRRKRERQTNTRIWGGRHSGMVNLAAHATSRAGNDLFFLVPFSLKKEGFRLAEYDRTGTEIGSFRLAVPTDELPTLNRSLRFDSAAVSLMGDEIAITVPQGLQYRFRRP